MLEQTLNVRVSQATAQRAKQLAKIRGIPVSVVARQALERYVAAEKSQSEVMLFAEAATAIIELHQFIEKHQAREYSDLAKALEAVKDELLSVSGQVSAKFSADEREQSKTAIADSFMQRVDLYMAAHPDISRSDAMIEVAHRNPGLYQQHARLVGRGR